MACNAVCLLDGLESIRDVFEELSQPASAMAKSTHLARAEMHIIAALITPSAIRVMNDHLSRRDTRHWPSDSSLGSEVQINAKYRRDD